MLGVVLLAVLACGCSEGRLASPTQPSDLSLEGTWQGWLSGLSAGTRGVTVTLFQVGSVLSGVWTLFDTGGGTAGSLTGTVVGSTALLTLRPYDPAACTISMVVLITSARLQGTWTTLDCGMSANGTFQLTSL